ncbi:hypothetical protein SUGI_0873980 [Cryptomeria japonica]|nr:hypothetical protein SUGI_0873980 [Cryptomeria japonica]
MQGSIGKTKRFPSNALHKKVKPSNTSVVSGYARFVFVDDAQTTRRVFHDSLIEGIKISGDFWKEEIFNSEITIAGVVATL